MTFRLTYSTMFDPPASLHQQFDQALAGVKSSLGTHHKLWIDGKELDTRQSHVAKSPVDHRITLGSFALANASHIEMAVQAAKKAYPSWSRTAAAQRLQILRRVADLIEQKVYWIAAAVALEVGKNRMESLGEVQETADFFRHYCDDFERMLCGVQSLPDDPLPNYRSHNRSVLKPYGVWAVINPFNFPFALAGGPVAAALVTGNTVVLKGAPDTAWSGHLLADCLREAGVPDGVFNYVGGSDAEAGQALVAHPDIAGVTFTGSYQVGMSIYRQFAAGAYPRPCIAEMGGKNAAIVTAQADLQRAVAGLTRSAFGLSGQKCSALSRIYVEDSVADVLIDQMKNAIEAIQTGDPTLQQHWMGPVINQAAMQRYMSASSVLQESAKVYAGAQRLTHNDLQHGFYVAPTLAEAELCHPLWQRELFLPLVMLHRVPDMQQAMELANHSDFGLTAGFYGSESQTEQFFQQIEAGVTYANRPQGATTGAWPGYQPFGGWKGSGTTGKGIASFYYLAHYQREQSQTWVE